MRNRSRRTRHVGTLVRERVGVSACGCVSASARGHVGALLARGVREWAARVGVSVWARCRVSALACGHVGALAVASVCGHVESSTCWHVGALASGCLAYLHCVLARGAWCMVHGHVGSRQGFLLFPTG